MKKQEPTSIPVHEKELLQIEQGEYSDYFVMGLYISEREFDMIEEANKWKASLSPEDRNEYGNHDQEGFIESLEAQGIIKEVARRKIHIGCYGRIEFLRSY